MGYDMTCRDFPTPYDTYEPQELYHVVTCDGCGELIKSDEIQELINYRLCPECYDQIHRALDAVDGIDGGPDRIFWRIFLDAYKIEIERRMKCQGNQSA